MDIFLNLLIFLFAALLGGVLYRFRGGWPSTPRPLEQMAFCSILLIAMIVFDVDYIAAFAAYVFSVAMCLKGHGHTMNYSTPVDLTKLEGYEFFTKWLIGKVPDYWYKVIAHSFGGFIVTALPGLLIAFNAPFTGAAIAICGLLKGVAYMIGWKLHPAYDDGTLKLNFGKFELNSATSWGEFFTGFFIWPCAAAAIMFTL